MAVPALVILPVSPDGTNVMTMGLSAEPSSPAATVGGLAIFSHTGGGGVGFTAVGAAAAAAVDAAVGAAAVVGSAAAAVGAGAVVGAAAGSGAVVAAGAA